MRLYYLTSSTGIVPFCVISFLLLVSLLSFFPPAKMAFALADFNFDAGWRLVMFFNAKNTENGIASKSPERVLGLGDYSYQPTATSWLDIIKPIDSITKIAIGNHEDDNEEDYNTYISHFGLSNPYYSFNYNNIHVLVMDTDGTSYSSGSSQYNFVVSDLK